MARTQRAVRASWSLRLRADLGLSSSHVPRREQERRKRELARKGLLPGGEGKRSRRGGGFEPEYGERLACPLFVG